FRREVVRRLCPAGETGSGVGQAVSPARHPAAPGLFPESKAKYDLAWDLVDATLGGLKLPTLYRGNGRSRQRLGDRITLQDRFGGDHLACRVDARPYLDDHFSCN